jgi:hypothetical protein
MMMNDDVDAEVIHVPEAALGADPVLHQGNWKPSTGCVPGQCVSAYHRVQRRKEISILQGKKRKHRDKTEIDPVYVGELRRA